MNLTGKILTFLIAVMSITFMALAIAVYASHKDWYVAVNRTQEETQGGKFPLGLKFQLENLRTQNNVLKEQLTALQEAKEATEAERKAVLAALEHERQARETEEKNNKEEYDKLNKQAVAALGALTGNQKNLDAATKEVEQLRKDIRAAQDDRDKKFEQIVKTTEEIHQTSGELNRQKERNDQLARQVARNKQVFDQLNVNPDNPPGAIPPSLRGKVLLVNKEKMLEISLGSDDGLQVGNKLEVFRGSKWLAKAEILKVDTDRAVAKIIPGYQKGPVQKDDDVATRFNNDLAAGAHVK